ncbi:unnamed protein product [Ixodes pacificus]
MFKEFKFKFLNLKEQDQIPQFKIKFLNGLIWKKKHESATKLTKNAAHFILCQKHYFLLGTGFLGYFSLIIMIYETSLELVGRFSDKT